MKTIFTRRSHGCARRGAAMVEAALTLTIALTLVLGVIEAGVAVMIYQGVAERVRDGARYAVLHPDDSTGTRNFVAYGNAEGAGAPLLGLRADQVTVETSMLDNEAEIAGVAVNLTLSSSIGSFLLGGPVVLTVRADAPVEGRATSP